MKPNLKQTAHKFEPVGGNAKFEVLMGQVPLMGHTQVFFW